MILVQGIIRNIYIIMTAFFGLLLFRGLFKRRTRTGLLYDIVYAYTLIPFLLRSLQIK